MIQARIKKLRPTFNKDTFQYNKKGFGDEQEWYGGLMSHNPKVGDNFGLSTIITSPVQKLFPQGVFSTKNSVYKLEFKEQPVTYMTYKFYDIKGRRMAIYGLQVGENIHIIAFHCNKKDAFSIKWAKQLYNKYYQGGECIGLVRVTKKGDSQEDFLRWCNSNYYKFKTIAVISPYIDFNALIINKRWNRKVQEIRYLTK